MLFAHLPWGFTYQGVREQQNIIWSEFTTSYTIPTYSPRQFCLYEQGINQLEASNRASGTGAITDKRKSKFRISGARRFVFNPMGNKILKLFIESFKIELFLNNSE